MQRRDCTSPRARARATLFHSTSSPRRRLPPAPLHLRLPLPLPARLPPPSGTTSRGSPVQRRTGAKYNREAPRLMSRPNKAKNRPLNNTRCNAGAAAKRGLARDARAERGMLLLLFLFKISRDAERERERERERGRGATCHESSPVPASLLPPPPRGMLLCACVRIFRRVIRRRVADRNLEESRRDVSRTLRR